MRLLVEGVSTRAVAEARASFDGRSGSIVEILEARPELRFDPTVVDIAVIVQTICSAAALFVGVSESRARRRAERASEEGDSDAASHELQAVIENDAELAQQVVDGFIRLEPSGPDEWTLKFNVDVGD